jgi:RNA polymerase sigma factor (sigma-70 family)
MIQPLTDAQRELDEREAALNRIATEHYGLMYRVAYRILRSPQDAEEALHNAWLNLCRTARLPQMRDERAYLAQAVRREAILLWKKHRRFPAAEEGAEMTVPDTRSSPEQAASGVEVQTRIDTLPAKERAVVTLWYREGLSLVEIAEALHLPEGTVRRRFMQAKANLKPMFEARQPAGLEVAAGEGSAR